MESRDISHKYELQVELFTPSVHICHYFEPSPGVWQPTKRGVALNTQEWENLKTYIQDIDQELRHQMTLRTERTPTFPDITKPTFSTGTASTPSVFVHQ